MLNRNNCSIHTKPQFVVLFKYYIKKITEIRMFWIIYQNAYFGGKQENVPHFQYF